MYTLYYWIGLDYIYIYIYKVTLLKNTHYAFNRVYRIKLLQKFVLCSNSCTRVNNRFIIPNCRINISCYAVHYASIQLWNNLSNKLKIIKLIKLFIKKLKISYL